MGNTEKNKTKKFTKKIKIRLLDPNIPDSYICEIFDSSLENEDDQFSNDDLSSEIQNDFSKPKNYFEVLMSKNIKKNIEINSTKQGEKCSKSNESYVNEAFLNKSNDCTKKGKDASTLSVDKKNKKTKNENESTENESCFQINGKPKIENPKEKNEKNKNPKIEYPQKDDDLVTVFVSPKLDLPGKKTLNILNYFSKTKTSLNSNSTIQKVDESAAAEVEANHLVNNSKSNKENDLMKLCQNSAKKCAENVVYKENIKLAPVFLKKNKTVLNSSAQKARLDFLYSKLPVSVKKSEEKTVERKFYFPKVTHVQQRNNSNLWSLREISLPLQKNCHLEYVFNTNKNFTLEIESPEILLEDNSECTVNFSKNQLSRVKFGSLNLDLDLLINGLKSKRDKFSAQLVKIENSKKNISKIINDDCGYEELYSLWTEKYKPNSNEILGNVSTVKKLKRWLELWKSFNVELRALVTHNQKPSQEESSSDVDDFLDFNSESYGLKAPSNVCIISGPNGCGKTALVYALANELEFGVLELNASSKRTGRKVLSDLQEATLSHKVHRVNLQQNLLIPVDKKKKKNQKRRKKFKSKSEVSDEIKKDCKISLILIEDADIVFDDHDEGFYSAMVSLVQTSKRPLIFITNESNCYCLENLKQDQCLILEMESPNFYESCAVLDIISSLEGVNFEKEVLEYLVRRNNFDLRKSLLELQFWSVSNKKIKNPQRIFDLGHLWWGLSIFLFRQNIRHFDKPKCRKRKRTKDVFDSSDDEVGTAAKKFRTDAEGFKTFSCMRTEAFVKASDPKIKLYYEVLDLVSALDGFYMTGSQEPIPLHDCRPKDSLTLDENMEEVLWSRSLTEQISNEMINLSSQIFLKGVKEEESPNRKLNFEAPTWEEIRWRHCQNEATEELSKVVSLQKGRDKVSLYLDYLPVLRNICRVEKYRSEVNPKRKNRFYHYLNNLGLEFSEEILEINCEIFDQ